MFAVAQRSARGGGTVPVPLGLCMGSVETNKSGAGQKIPTPPKTKHTSPFQTCESRATLVKWAGRKILAVWEVPSPA